MTRELPLECPKRKTLGKWDCKEAEGGVFVKAGIYQCGKVIKTRGVNMAALDKSAKIWINSDIVAAWKRGDKTISTPYRQYISLGAATASEERWKIAGHWIDGERECAIDEIGLKRASLRGDKSRAKQLVPSSPADNLSFEISKMYDPEWLDEDEHAERLDATDQAIIDEASGAND